MPPHHPPPKQKQMPPLTLSPALESDAGAISSIHMAAFGLNAMLHAQFPTPHIRAQLQLAIIDKTIRDIRDAGTAVLVVRAGRQGQRSLDKDQDQEEADGEEVVSFARWNLPVEGGWVEPAWKFPEGTEWGVLKAWTEMVDAAQERVLGGEACYREFFFFWFGLVWGDWGGRGG